MTKQFDANSIDLAELHGHRVIVCPELKAGDRLDESGRQTPHRGRHVEARRMRQDSSSFVPTHKLFLLGNRRPEAGTGGFAFWRRIRLVASAASPAAAPLPP
ncbi:hypothetical protein [Streptomyces sp. x-19]|uniref:hypothetical protein n=1 Tax=Streptomyces sp. x-19 TaxID=2789280 RepID=UPI00397ED8D3